MHDSILASTDAIVARTDGTQGDSIPVFRGPAGYDSKIAGGRTKRLIRSIQNKMLAERLRRDDFIVTVPSTGAVCANSYADTAKAMFGPGFGGTRILGFERDVSQHREMLRNGPENMTAMSGDLLDFLEFSGVDGHAVLVWSDLFEEFNHHIATAILQYVSQGRFLLEGRKSLLCLTIRRARKLAAITAKHLAASTDRIGFVSDAPTEDGRDAEAIAECCAALARAGGRGFVSTSVADVKHYPSENGPENVYYHVILELERLPGFVPMRFPMPDAVNGAVRVGDVEFSSLFTNHVENYAPRFSGMDNAEFADLASKMPASRIAEALGTTAERVRRRMEAQGVEKPARGHWSRKDSTALAYGDWAAGRAAAKASVPGVGFDEWMESIGVRAAAAA